MIETTQQTRQTGGPQAPSTQRTNETSSGSEFSELMAAAESTDAEETGGEAEDGASDTVPGGPASAGGAAAVAAAAAIEKPSIAQFMIATGSDFETASNSLYVYNNWQTYLEGREIPDLSSAQRQLKTEVTSGVRAGTLGNYGAREDYAPPTFPEPEEPGSIVPVFAQNEPPEGEDVPDDFDPLAGAEVVGLGFVGADGTRYTTASFNDRRTIENHAIGFGLGKKSLDNFAQQHGFADFESIDFTALKENFLKGREYAQKFGPENVWNPVDGMVS